MIEVCVRLSWQALGPITLELGKLQLPRPPASPGLYRFDLPAAEGMPSAYIGQTDGLPRRFNHYRNPGPSQRTNIRINAWLMEVLRQGGGQVQVSVAVEGELAVAGHTAPLDFTNKAHRLIAEGAAVVAEGGEDVMLANL
jgi:hypothetical protein